MAGGRGGAGGSGVELWGEDGEEKVAGPSYRGDPGISAGRSGIMIPASSPGISGAPRSREGRGEEGADAWGRLVSGGARVARLPARWGQGVGERVGCAPRRGPCGRGGNGAGLGAWELAVTVWAGPSGERERRVGRCWADSWVLGWVGLLLGFGFSISFPPFYFYFYSISHSSSTI